MLTLLSLALLLPQTTGLQEGESITKLAPVANAESPDLRHGRIVDAFSGMPVARATVETWTEEIDPDTGGFFRIGEATSGADGCFAVMSRFGKKPAEKVRVQADGYLTLSMTLGDIHNSILLFPAQAEPTRIRAIDAMGLAVPGMLVTSTYTCAHDVPAFSESTDSTGLVELSTYGLQDEVPDLRLRTLGFGAIKYLDGDEVFSGDRPSNPYVARLKRRAPISYTLLNKAGEPWAGASLVILDNEGHHVLHTGSDGRFRIDSRYGEGPFDVYLLESPEQRYVGTFPGPEGLSLVVRDRPEDWPEEVPTGTLAIQLPEGAPNNIWVSHTDGWLNDVSPKEIDGFEFPAGKGVLIIGGSFTGARELVLPFELEAGKHLELQVKLEREPVITVLAPESKSATLWVQGEKETLDLDGAPTEPFSVPANESVCFIFEDKGEVRRFRTENVTDGQVIDLHAESTIVQRQTAPARHAEERFVVPAGCTLSVHSPSGLFTLKSDSPDSPASDNPGQSEFVLSGPLGGQFLVELQSPGCLSTYVRARMEGGEPHAPWLLIPIPLASLTIKSESKVRVTGFDEVDLRQLSPGPLNLVLVSGTGERFGLQLNLKAGEHRVIEL